jgi:hypothetical protein
MAKPSSRQSAPIKQKKTEENRRKQKKTEENRRNGS